MAGLGKRKIKQFITLNDKLEILKMHDSMTGNIKLNKLAKLLKISRSTLVTIINNRESIEGAPETDRDRCRMRNKKINPCAGKSKYQKLEKALEKWVEGIKQKGGTFNGVSLRKQARKLAGEMGFDNFTASNGWSDRFKKKYKIEYKVRPCYCEYKLEDEIPDTTNYGVENFLDKIVEKMKEVKTAEIKKKICTEKKSKISLIELRLIQWLDEAKNELSLTKISGSLIREMALSLAGVMGITNFTASSGWLNRFKKKHHLFKHKKCRNCKTSLKDLSIENETENNSKKVSKNSSQENTQIAKSQSIK